ncbi:MAG: orotate phosphoribosyltransferase [Flavobacteriales bacterium]|nr:orotate phosphoribosyltransferase [Flavobacteriales bacterium]|tara:strand:+ start:1095 stop:1736 length:642 start_codon:yes stop_codon:yes gene_type:complete
MILDKKVASQTAKYLLQINAIKLNPENPFLWASGWKSPIYCDNRILLSYPKIRNYISDILASNISKLYGNKITIAGVATGAIAIGVLVAAKLNCPFVYVRPEPKKHGRKNQIEGELTKNSKVVVVEDLISTGKSSLNSVKAIRDQNIDVLGMIAIFSYGFESSLKEFKTLNVNLSTLSDYEFLLSEALKQKIINSSVLDDLKKWRKSPENWNN